MYNTLVERCFRDCIESFRQKDLDSSEEKVCCCLLSLAPHSYQLSGPQIREFPAQWLKEAVPVQCVSKCCEKFIKHSARTGLRFAELSGQSEQMQGMR